MLDSLKFLLNFYWKVLSNLLRVSDVCWELSSDSKIILVLSNVQIFRASACYKIPRLSKLCAFVNYLPELLDFHSRRFRWICNKLLGYIKPFSKHIMRVFSLEVNGGLKVVEQSHGAACKLTTSLRETEVKGVSICSNLTSCIIGLE